MEAVDLAIIGGGPAALAAAAEAANAGVQRILVVDENRTLGGQYYRQLPGEFRVVDAAALDRDYQAGQDLIEGARRETIHVIHRAVVWGIEPDAGTMSLATEDSCWTVQAKAFLLASGAYDRPIAFPGWTLPGVMTAGAAQIMLKAYRVLPGRRVLVAGSGPLLLALTHQVLEAGAHVVAVVETCPVIPVWQHLGQATALLGDWRSMLDGARYWRSLRSAGVPYLTGHTIVRAEGETEVTHAVVARLDGESRPLLGTEQGWDVDAVCAGYGFLPSTELARSCRCEFEYAPQTGCFVPRVDDWQESSVENVFVAGDAGGIGGVKVAGLQGRLAAVAIAHRLGALTGARFVSQEQEIRAGLARLRRFRAAMDEIFAFDERLQRHLITPETIICRCEEITAREVEDAIQDGAEDVYGVKLRSNAGLGTCQGRNCGPIVTLMIAARAGKVPAAVKQASLRPPVRPVPMAVLASCKVPDPVSPPWSHAAQKRSFGKSLKEESTTQ
jgi:NADPH-dependent 2,4-dienoyl-CoA reductase/sulfur reductase-like enzyme/bacterioferritin-associated ferredoxin